MAFLVWLGEKTLSLAEQVIRRGRPLRRARGMVLYRLARGTRGVLNSRSPPRPGLPQEVPKWVISSRTGDPVRAGGIALPPAPGRLPGISA